MRIRHALIGALLVALVGCGGGEGRVIGKYKGQISMGSNEKKRPGLGARRMASRRLRSAQVGSASRLDTGAALGEGLANAFASAMTLELKPDHTFTMSMIFPIEGKWSMAGNTITLTRTKAMGMDASAASKDGSNQPMEFEVSGDGKTLTAKRKEGKDKGEMKFVKES
jgi:hypothetical protein